MTMDQFASVGKGAMMAEPVAIITRQPAPRSSEKTPVMPLPKRPPVFREDGTIEIHLTRGHVAIIDADDAHLAFYNWSANVTPQGKVYAQRSLEPGVAIGLHREILGLPPGRDPEVDHKDGESLNCRRQNLRVVSVSGNRQNKSALRNNTSGFMGVTFNKRYGTWSATIGVSGKRKYLGSFATAGQANAARLAAERKLWGIHPQREKAHEKG